MAYPLPSQAMNVIRGPVAVLESTIHARAISWWERTQCLRWHALLKRRQGGITSAYDDRTRDAFRKFSGRENLEERWFEDARLDRMVLEFMRQKLRGK